MTTDVWSDPATDTRVPPSVWDEVRDIAREDGIEGDATASLYVAVELVLQNRLSAGRMGAFTALLPDWPGNLDELVAEANTAP